LTKSISVNEVNEIKIANSVEVFRQ